MKRFLAFLLTFAMVLGMIPVSTFAVEPEANEITVYTTVSKHGSIVEDENGHLVAEVPITLSGKSQYTIDDVFTKLHNDYYNGGASKGYGTENGSYGLSLCKLWGVENGYNFGYQINHGDISAWGLTQELSDGDYLEAYINESYYPDSEAYSRFDKYTVNTVVDKDIELTLGEVSGYDDNWNMVFSASTGSAITVNGVKTDKVTDENGGVRISFDGTGEYVVSAVKSKIVNSTTVTAITAPVCKVSVFASEDEIQEQAIKDELSKALETVTADLITIYDADGNVTNDTADLSQITTDLKLYDFDSNNEYYKDGVRLSWNSDNPSITVNYLRAKVNRPAGKVNATGKLTVTAKKNGIMLSKSFDTVVVADEEKKENISLDSIIESLANTYAGKDVAWWNEKADWWTTVAVGAAEDYLGKELLSKEQKQAFANKAINDVKAYLELMGSEEASEASNASKLSGSINGLSALGFDANDITALDDTKLNIGTALSKLNMTGAQKGYFSTLSPYVYIALNQGSYGDVTLNKELEKYMLSIRKTDGGWGWSSTSDLDTTGMILQGISLIDTPESKLACQEAADFIKKSYIDNEASTFGNANTDAVIIMALNSLGINTEAGNYIKEDKSLTDGMLSYLNADKTMFTFYGKDNDLATKQGLLALVSVAQLNKTGKAVNIMDFSAKAKTPVVETKQDSSDNNNDNTPSGNDEITVYFSLKSDKSMWIAREAVKVSKDATVCDVFTKVLKEKGYKYDNPNDNYVEWIETPDGDRLTQFDKGQNSGWMYRYNDELVKIGLCDLTVEDKAEIEWFYETDYTHSSGSSNNTNNNTTTPETPSTEISASDKFSDIPDTHWAKDYIYDLVNRGLVNGKAEGKFAPNDNITRAEIIAMISRLSGDELSNNESKFDDVKSDSWCAKNISWAVENKIVNGVSEGKFAPSANVTRQDIAVMLVRYLKYKGIELPQSEETVKFNDNADIASYATEAVELMQRAGIINGRENNSFMPKQTATRAEVAKMISLIIKLTEQ